MTDKQPKFERVMLIDDNTIDLYVTSRMMKKSYFGAQIDQYTSAVNALEFLKQHTEHRNELPQIIFVDIYMPQMSGFEFMMEYDKLPSELKSYCKVYIISSSIDKNDLQRANDDINVVAFQVKSITEDFLESIS